MPPMLGRGAPPPPQPQQLPPQMFTTAAQLLDLTDSKAQGILNATLPHYANGPLQRSFWSVYEMAGS